MLLMDSDRAMEPPVVVDDRRASSATAQPHRVAWYPLAGPALLERLRNTGRPRPRSDPEFAHMLRDRLEHGLAVDAPTGDDRCQPHAGQPTEVRRSPSPRPLPLVVTKDRLTRVLACETHRLSSEFGERTPTIAMACGAIIDVLFRQLVCQGSIGEPMADGLAALAVDEHQQGLVSWIERMPRGDLQELRAEVERQSDGLRCRWPALEASWMPRTQESMRVGLAGGSVDLSARVDLAIGRPAGDEASVVLVEIKSGARRPDHRADLHFYALIEAVRNPAPPFAVATYYTRTGELDVEPVTEELLEGAVRRTIAGARALRSGAEGADPPRHPNAQCALCSSPPHGYPGPAQVDPRRVITTPGRRAA
jgi:hypothetical protein